MFVVPGLVLAMACLDLVGWFLHLPRFTSVFAHYATMKPNTAVCLLLLAVACWGRAARSRTGMWDGALADMAGCFALFLSGGTLIEYGLHIRERGWMRCLYALPVLAAGCASGANGAGDGVGCLTLAAFGDAA